MAGLNHFLEIYKDSGFFFLIWHRILVLIFFYYIRLISYTFSDSKSQVFVAHVLGQRALEVHNIKL